MREKKITELLPKLDLAKRADFEGDKKTPPKKIEKLEKELKRLQKDLKLKSVESRFDEEHNLWEVRFVNSQGAEHIINWELASTPECRQLISKFKQIEEYLEPPFVVESMPRASKAGEAGRAQRRRTADGECGEAERGRRTKKRKAEKKSAKASRAAPRSRRSWRRQRRAISSTTS